MSNFEICYAQLAANEGGLSNDANDRGGPTAYGIASRAWPADYAAVMALPEAERPEYVKRFYRARFWDANHLDLIEDPNVAYQLFDMAANHGTAEPLIRYIQTTMDFFGHHMKADGVLGPVTASAINARPSVSLLLATVKRVQIYSTIVASNPTQAGFIPSWLTRTSARV